MPADLPPQAPRDAPPSRLPDPPEFLRPRFLLAAVLLGAGCGLIGAGFSQIVVLVERLAYGFSTGTFAEAVTSVAPVRRFATVVVAGVVVALLWYVLRRFGPQIPSPARIADGTVVPVRWMLADTVLQVVNVAAGGSIGREGAPRQLGALTGSRAAGWFTHSSAQRRLLVGCGAGAGLAAIYDVPVGGALFTCEVMIGLQLLRRSRPLSVICSGVIAAGTSWLATLVARVAVPDRPTYGFDGALGDPRLLLVALGVGLVLGPLGYGFGLLLDRVARAAPQGRRLLWTMPLCYLGLAALALPLPLVLGNGHALAESVFAGTLPITIAALLVAAKPLATLLTVRAGATGGRLTPSLATGAAAGAALAGVLGPVWPVPVATTAVLGAAAVLVGTMPALLTAAALVIEFTGFAPAGWYLILITVAAAGLSCWLIRRVRRGSGGAPRAWP